MEPPKYLETYLPSRLYPRIGWAALGGALVCALCGLRAPLAFIPAVLCAATGLAMFWLYRQPPVRLADTQFNIGIRSIAWREVRQINNPRIYYPLIIDLKLTNNRHKWMIYAGEPEQIDRLMYKLRKGCFMATFDGVSHRDYWAWSDVTPPQPETPAAEQPPVRMVSTEEEDEIERLYQKLKTVGRLDARNSESKTSEED